MQKKTIVIGASPKSERFSNKAVRLLNVNGHPVIAQGIREGKIGEIEIIRGKPQVSDIHTVTMYIGTARQPEYYDYILGLNPQRIIFNPGTENPELKQMAKEKGIETVENCTLVMLNTGLF
ncbi:MAG: CoA-binding protein [Bacteroidales bacterium]|nr:CoA-binding protein [Bacteroidales bacterium]